MAWQGGPWSAMCPKLDLIQDVLTSMKKTMYFKLTLCDTGGELKVAVWASRILKQFLLYVCSAIHACRQMGLDASFTNAAKTITTIELEAELVKSKYVHVCNSEKKKTKDNKGEVMNADAEMLSVANRL